MKRPVIKLTARGLVRGTLLLCSLLAALLLVQVQPAALPARAADLLLAGLPALLLAAAWGISLARYDWLAARFAPLVRALMAYPLRAWLAAFVILQIGLAWGLVLDGSPLFPQGASVLGLVGLVGCLGWLAAYRWCVPRAAPPPSQPHPTRRTRRITVGILAVSALTSVWMWVYTQPTFTGDSTSYFQISQGLLGRADLDPYWYTYGYPLLIAFTRLLYDNVVSVILVQEILRALVAAAAFYIIKPTHYGLAALVGFLLAASPLTAHQAHSLMTESIYGSLVMLLALLTFAAARQPPGRRLALSLGLLCALIAFFRPSGLFLSAVPLLIGLLQRRWGAVLLVTGGLAGGVLALASVQGLIEGRPAFGNNSEAYYPFPLMQYGLYDPDNGPQSRLYQQALDWEGCENDSDERYVMHQIDDCAVAYNWTHGTAASTRAVYIEAILAQPVKWLSAVYYDAQFFLSMRRRADGLGIWQISRCVDSVRYFIQHPNILPVSEIARYVCVYDWPNVPVIGTVAPAAGALLFHEFFVQPYRILSPTTWAGLWSGLAMLGFILIEAKPGVRRLVIVAALVVAYHVAVTTAGQYTTFRYVLVLTPLFVVLSASFYQIVWEGLRKRRV